MKFYISLIISFFFTFNSFAQSDKLIKQHVHFFQEYNKYYQEYFYTQFNKSNYFPGENIWFQVYIIDSQKRVLSDITKKVYADFFNSNGKLIERKVLKSENGLANNFYKIPEDYKNEKLFLKVSTNWSKNYDQEFFDEIRININPKVDEDKSKEIEKGTSRINFFPESGHLIEGVPTNIGVKVVDEFNNGFFFLGEIEDEQGHLVVTFKTNDLGIGNFNFHPQPNKKYRLRQFFEVDKSQLYLPEANKKGVLLNVLKSGKVFKVFFRTNTQSNNFKEFHYIIYNQNNIALAGSFNFNGGKVFLKSIKNVELLSGINTITLFDENFHPIAERVFFNSKGINFNSDIITVSNYADKDSINIRLYNKGKDSLYSVAVSILPKESISQFPKQSFLSKYYLSSVIKGFVENPTYYFEKKENINELDNLLLTQGWRKFDWNKIQQTNSSKLKYKKIKFLFETGIHLNGTVRNKQNNLPLKNENVTLIYNDLINITVTDSSGNFTFVNKGFNQNDSVKILVNAEKKIQKNILINSKKVLIDSFISIPNNFERRIKSIKLKSIIAENYESNINIYDEGEKLDEIELFVVKKIKEEEIDTYVNPMDNTTFTDSFHINEDNVDKFRSVLNYLESLPGLEIVANGNTIFIYSSRTMQQRIETPKPLDVYMDNVKLNNWDIETLGLLDLNVVRNINVNKSGIGYGSESPYGRISIYLNYGAATYRNKAKKNDDVSNVLEFIINDGFDEYKEYYTPDYKFLPEDVYYKKYATTHWKPNLKVSKKGKGYKFKIPNSINKYILLIEGISDKGDIISLKKEIEIN